jgi:hypothetical protein
MAPIPARNGRIASSLFCACYLPVICLLSANNLPVIFLFRAPRREGALFLQPSENK